ncbi:MAG: hypothetical protein Q7S74_05985 [Nanoarchaeota archaeon]|nr:hypothetical protein [Nanoarchaeota archaeon]
MGTDLKYYRVESFESKDIRGIKFLFARDEVEAINLSDYELNHIDGGYNFKAREAKPTQELLERVFGYPE